MSERRVMCFRQTAASTAHPAVQSDSHAMPCCTRPHKASSVSQMPRRRARQGLFFLLLITLYTQIPIVVSKGSTSVKSSTTTTVKSSTITSTSTSTKYVYGSSVGTVSRLRITSVAVITYLVLFNGNSYPSMRIYYDGYYDDCALRNITSSRLGGSDAAIDPSATALLEQWVPSIVTYNDIVVFNDTLYNQTNGLIVDPAYCNYTSTSAAGALRWPVVGPLLVALATALLLGRRGRSGL